MTDYVIDIEKIRRDHLHLIDFRINHEDITDKTRERLKRERLEVLLANKAGLLEIFNRKEI